MLGPRFFSLISLQDGQFSIVFSFYHQQFIFRQTSGCCFGLGHPNVYLASLLNPCFKVKQFPPELVSALFAFGLTVQVLCYLLLSPQTHLGVLTNHKQANITCDNCTMIIFLLCHNKKTTFFYSFALKLCGKESSNSNIFFVSNQSIQKCYNRKHPAK